MPEREEGPRKPGTRPRGARGPITVRVPEDQKAHYQECATKLGIALSDYVALVLAERHGMPVPSYIKVQDPDGPHQEELRIA